MLALTIYALFAVVGIASVVTLIDCWVRARFVIGSIHREKALVEAGYTALPELDLEEMRTRKVEPMSFGAVAAFSRPSRQHSPLHRRPRTISDAA